MKTILGDQSPWNGGLLRAQALQKSGIDFMYQHHDADLPGVVMGSPTGVSRGNPPYFSLACRLPLGLSKPTPKQESVINVCRASLHPLVYLQYMGRQTIRGIGHKISDQVARMFKSERDHLSAISGVVLPEIRSIEEAFKLHAGGIVIGSVIDMFHETPPLLLNRLDPTNFWGIDQDMNRMPYSPRSDWHATIPRGSAMLLEFAVRGLRFGLSNCPYQSEVVRLRDRCLRGTQISVLKIGFHWDADFLGEQTAIGKAWRKKRQPDFSEVIRYWSSRPTSMGVLAFGNNVRHSLEECEW